jgi:hypothetical protein
MSNADSGLAWFRSGSREQPGQNGCVLSETPRPAGENAGLRGDAYVRSVCRHGSRSSCEALFLVLHPLTNEIRARDDAKLAAFTADEIHQCHPIQLFQIREIE